MNKEQPDNQVQIHPLLIDPPWLLENALGYDGQARHVAFYWSTGDEVYVTDGYISAVGEWDAYLLLVRHPLVADKLGEYNLGSNDNEATHWLLLDREERQLAIAPAPVAQQLLTDQWGIPSLEHVVVIPDAHAWQQLINDVQVRLGRIGQEQIVTLMQQHQHLIQDLAAWLNTQWLGLATHHQLEHPSK